MKEPRFIQSFLTIIIFTLLLCGVLAGGVQSASAGEGAMQNLRLEDNPSNNLVDGSIRAPFLQVRVNANEVEFLQWEEGDIVTLQIDDPNTPQNPDFIGTQRIDVMPWDPSQTYLAYYIGGSYRIKTGDVVSASDGTYTKTITIKDLYFTGFDVQADIVYGYAIPGSKIDIWVYSASRYVEAGSDGTWSADFGKNGTAEDEQTAVDIVPGTWVDSQILDNDGDNTRCGVIVPIPQIKAFLSENRIETVGWPVNDASLDLTITGGDQPYSATLSTTGQPWDGFPGYANLVLGSDFTLAPDQEITITDGYLTRTLTVMDLSVTDFERTARTVSGHSDGNIHIGVNLYLENGYLDVTVPGNGSWLADYSQIFPDPFLPSTGGDITSWDGDGDATIVRINMGHIYTWPGGDNVVIDGVAKYREYTLTIDDPSTNNDFNSTLLSSPCDWWGDCGMVDFPLDGFPLDAGDVITITSGSFVRSLTVAPRGEIFFDTDQDIVYGKNPGYAYVEVDTPNSWQYVKTEPDGSWSIDLTGVEDIKPGLNGGVQIIDEDGDQTGYGWTVPNPQIRALLSENRVEAAGWPFGATVTLSIDVEGETAYTDSQVITTGAPWDGAAGYANFDLGLGFTLAPGQKISMTDGPHTKELIVMDLWVDSFDPVGQTVTGYADAGAGVQVGVWLNNYWPTLMVQANDDTGFWTATFTQSEQLFLPWTSGDISSWDADGDVTTYQINRGNVNVWPGGDVVRDGCTLSRMYTLTIDDPANGEGTDFTRDRQCIHTADGMNTTVAYQLEGFTLDAGDLITVASGHDIRTLIVTPRGSVSFDIENDIIRGKNQPYNYVRVWINEVQSWRTVQAGFDGTWSIDYKEPGPNGDPAEDIVRGMSGGVVEYNAVGDNTGYGWYMPFLDVHPQYDLVYAVGWNRGDVLTLSVKDSLGNDLADLTATVGDAPWGDPNATAGDFPLAGFDLQPGQVLTVTGPVGKIIYTIPDPKITKFDVIADTVSGTGTAGKRMQVLPNYPGLWLGRNVPVDGIGNWTVSFAPSSNPSDSPGSFDLQPGSQVAFSEIDEYRDQTWGDDWTIPYPTNGSATGAGVFDSPAGAYPRDPAFAGKVSFQFEAKYGKTGTLTGSVQLEFKGFGFQSTVLDWMAIEGDRIQLTGTEKVNGKGAYGFMINAVDGNLPGAGGMDMFRIRIWDKATGEVVYDNLPGAADSTSPNAPVKNGEITILKKPD